MTEKETLIFLDHETGHVACPGCADVSMCTAHVPEREPVVILCDFCDILILDQLHAAAPKTD